MLHLFLWVITLTYHLACPHTKLLTPVTFHSKPKSNNHISIVHKDFSRNFFLPLFLGYHQFSFRNCLNQFLLFINLLEVIINSRDTSSINTRNSFLSTPYLIIKNKYPFFYKIRLIINMNTREKILFLRYSVFINSEEVKIPMKHLDCNMIDTIGNEERCKHINRIMEM